MVLMLDNKAPDTFNGRPDENPLFVYLRKQRGGQKEWCFVLVPNKTFSSFREDDPIPPKGQTQELHIPEPVTTRQDDNDLPW